MNAPSVAQSHSCADFVETTPVARCRTTNAVAAAFLRLASPLPPLGSRSPPLALCVASDMVCHPWCATTTHLTQRAAAAAAAKEAKQRVAAERAAKPAKQREAQQPQQQEVRLDGGGGTGGGDDPAQ